MHIPNAYPFCISLMHIPCAKFLCIPYASQMYNPYASNASLCMWSRYLAHLGETPVVITIASSDGHTDM